MEGRRQFPETAVAGRAENHAAAAAHQVAPVAAGAGGVRGRNGSALFRFISINAAANSLLSPLVSPRYFALLFEFGLVAPVGETAVACPDAENTFV